MKDILEFLAAHEKDHLDRLKQILEIPSVSTDPAHAGDVRRCAESVRALLEWAGLEARVVDTPGHPVVHGRRAGRGGKRPALLYYGHYDVQPPDPLGEWRTPPFRPDVRDGVLYARGAADDKGQVFCHIAALAAWMAVRGDLPVDVQFMVEGEEEVGSPNLAPFIEERRKELGCDYVVVSDTAQYEDIPAICYGLRGLVYLEVEFRGPSQDLHSGVFGGSVTNPANALAALIAGMHGPDGKVTIPGFYDRVRDIEAWERKAWGALPFDEEAAKAALGVKALAGERGYTPIERRWARPTLDVNGMVSGYTGPGAKTIIPARARAKVSMRLVPDQDPEEIRQAFERHVREKAPAGVTVEIQSHHGAPAVVIPTGTPGMTAARDALEAGFGKEPVFIREGGSIPIVSTFRKVLGADTLLLGFGRSTDNIHGPNEHFHLADLHAGVRAAAHLVDRMAAALSSRPARRA